MVIVGFYNGAPKTIQKMTNKLAVDFDGQRYKWEVEDDSTTTQLQLTELVGGPGA